MKKLILLILSIISFSNDQPHLGQGINSSQIDGLVARALETTPSVGIAVAVVKDGGVQYACTEFRMLIGQ